MTDENFDELVISLAEPVHPSGPVQDDDNPIYGDGMDVRPIPCPSDDPIRLNIPMIDLAARIECKFERLFNSSYKSPIDFFPSDLVSREEVWAVVKNYEMILDRGLKLSKIFGGEPLAGTYSLITQCIIDWKSSDSYSTHMESLRKIEEESQRLEDLRLEEIRAKEERAKYIEKQKKARKELKRLNAQIREEKSRQREQRGVIAQHKRARTSALSNRRSDIPKSTLVGGGVINQDLARLASTDAHRRPRSSIIAGMIEELIDPSLLHRTKQNEPNEGSSTMQGMMEGLIDPGLKL